jgi:type II secretory pathway pseudopilin PulG
VVVLLIAGFAGAVAVLYAADLVLRARARARRRSAMSERLAAATARAEEQHQRRQAAAHASRELTALIPAIKRPPLSTPGGPARAAGSQAAGSQAGSPPDGVHRGVPGSS